MAYEIQREYVEQVERLSAGLEAARVALREVTRQLEAAKAESRWLRDRLNALERGVSRNVGE